MTKSQENKRKKEEQIEEKSEFVFFKATKLTNEAAMQSLKPFF